MRIAILWTELSGYLNACLKELAGRPGVELFVGHQVSSQDAPFALSQFEWIENRLMWRDQRSLRGIATRLKEFNPDVLVFSGWHVRGYRDAARAFKGKAWRVMTMDNCWLGTLKQMLAVIAAPAFPRPLADAVWVSGERQAVFARKLRFEQRVILNGLYSCDSSAFHAARLERIADGNAPERKFLFVGRLAREKGIRVLAQAYSAYRARVSAPWPLICCGTGSMETVLDGQPGIEMTGFIQPSELPRLMSSAACLVLPSDFEPWAVVVHEAACAGLPVLASNRVGSAIHLVQPGYNGYLFDSQDTEGLAGLMQAMTEMSEPNWRKMSDASFQLSHQYSTERWADILLEGYSMAMSADSSSR